MEIGLNEVIGTDGMEVNLPLPRILAQTKYGGLGFIRKQIPSCMSIWLETMPLLTCQAWPWRSPISSKCRGLGMLLMDIGLEISNIAIQIIEVIGSSSP